MHPQSKLLRQELARFVETHTCFIVEVPSFRGNLEINLPEYFTTPYSNHIEVQSLSQSISVLIKETRLIQDEASLLFNRIHEVLCIQATEVVVFMINCKDRMQLQYFPSSVPLAYAMKGKSLSNQQLQFMINKVRDVLKLHNIKVLAECYDGQWQNTVMMSEDGFPLNRLRLQNTTWNKVSTVSKNHLMEDLLSTNKISTGDKDLLKFTKFPIGNTVMLNVQVTRHLSGRISFTLLGGPLFDRPVASMFVTVKNMKDLPKDDVNQGQTQAKPKKQYGLHSDEKSLLCTLPSSILEEFECQSSDEEELEDDQLPDITNEGPPQSKLAKLLTSDNFNLLQEIIDELQELDYNKWSRWTVDDLFPDLLRNASKLMSTCIVRELNIIGKILLNYIGRSFFSSSFNKAKNCNLISGAFEGTNFVDEICKKDRLKSNVHNPKSLFEISKMEINKDSYPSAALKVSYAHVLHMFQKGEYLSRCHTNLTAVIPHKMARKDPTTMELFCYPEFSISRNQLEPHTLDYSHILTNIHTHICNKGYEFCPNEHYVQLCENEPQILSKAAVMDHIDAQNVFTAI